MRILWLVLLVIFLVAEGVTAALVSVWFAAGSLVALIISLISPTAYVSQLVAFIIVSGICVFSLRPLTRKFLGGNIIATNADANIGKCCQVVQEIQPGRAGRVKLEGLEWMAVCDHVMPVGSWGRIIAIDGVKLVIIPVEQEINKEQN